MNTENLNRTDLNSKLVKIYITILFFLTLLSHTSFSATIINSRQKLNNNFKYIKYESLEESDRLIFNNKTKINNYKNSKTTNSTSDKSENIYVEKMILKQSILPTRNKFLNSLIDQFQLLEGNTRSTILFIKNHFVASSWDKFNLHHAKVSNVFFYEGENAEVNGSMT